MRAVRIISYKNMKNKCRKDDSLAEKYTISFTRAENIEFNINHPKER